MNQPPNVNTAEIEHIVRLVVQRLMRDGAMTSSAQPNNKPSDVRPAGELRLDSRLITLDALDGKLGQHVTTLCVPVKAVVTPAVRDELKERGIELRRADATDGDTSRLRPKVVVATKQSLNGVWAATENEKLGSLTQAVERAISRSKQDQMAVLLTEQPEVAACAANRTQGVRALALCGHSDWKASDWKATVRTLGANLVICNPAHWGESDVPQFLATLWELRGTAGPTWFK